MRRASNNSAWLGLAAFALLAATGCQVDVGGQTLPSPWWHKDDVQYFPPGHEFKLIREAAAMSAADQQQAEMLPPAAAAGALPPPALP